MSWSVSHKLNIDVISMTKRWITTLKSLFHDTCFTLDSKEYFLDMYIPFLILLKMHMTTQNIHSWRIKKCRCYIKVHTSCTFIQCHVFNVDWNPFFKEAGIFATWNKNIDKNSPFQNWTDYFRQSFKWHFIQFSVVYGTLTIKICFLVSHYVIHYKRPSWSWSMVVGFITTYATSVHQN